MNEKETYIYMVLFMFIIDESLHSWQSLNWKHIWILNFYRFLLFSKLTHCNSIDPHYNQNYQKFHCVSKKKNRYFKTIRTRHQIDRHDQRTANRTHHTQPCPDRWSMNSIYHNKKNKSILIHQLARRKQYNFHLRIWNNHFFQSKIINFTIFHTNAAAYIANFRSTITQI